MRNKNLYQPSGYLDFEQVVDDEAPFAFVIGGRGTGKTFGALDYCKRHFDKTGKPFIYMRRSKAQAELVATSIFNPFRPLNDMYDWTVEPFSISKGVSGFYNSERDDDGRLHPVGNYVGIIAALSMILYSLMGVVGATMDLGLLWSIADTFNGLMAIPNLIALFLLSGTVVKLVKEKF